MKTSAINELYDETYANIYDEHFITKSDYKHVADFETEIIKSLLHSRDLQWLDVACGTGHFLSLFPGYKRAGIDISPDMLNMARHRNPDALFIEHADFRDEHSEWKDRWDLTSSMWAAYSYVDSMNELATFVKNMASWTKDTGVCFVPLCHAGDILLTESLVFSRPDLGLFGGTLEVNAVIWSWTDERANKRHSNLVAPHLEQMLELFKQYFSRVEVVFYPPSLPPALGQRRALIATGKRGNVSKENEQALSSILVESAKNRAEFLRLFQIESQKTSNSHHSHRKNDGWLRKTWRLLPLELRSFLKQIAGE